MAPKRPVAVDGGSPLVRLVAHEDGRSGRAYVPDASTCPMPDYHLAACWQLTEEGCRAGFLEEVDGHGYREFSSLDEFAAFLADHIGARLPDARVRPRRTEEVGTPQVRGAVDRSLSDFLTGDPAHDFKTLAFLAESYGDAPEAEAVNAALGYLLAQRFATETYEHLDARDAAAIDAALASMRGVHGGEGSAAALDAYARVVGGEAAARGIFQDGEDASYRCYQSEMGHALGALLFATDKPVHLIDTRVGCLLTLAGRMLVEAHRYGDAARTLTNAVRLEPVNVEAHLTLAGIYREGGETASLRREIQAAYAGAVTEALVRRVEKVAADLGEDVRFGDITVRNRALITAVKNLP